MKRFIKEFQKGIKDFSHHISVIVNSVLLSLVYIIGVGITFIFSKLSKKHFLNTKFEKKKSYWNDLNLKKESIEEYYKQF